MQQGGLLATDAEGSQRIVEQVLREGYQQVVLNNMGTAIVVSTLVLIACAIVACVFVFRINLLEILRGIPTTLARMAGNTIGKRERRFHRDLQVGAVAEQRRKVKIYRFLNDLIIDLGYKKRGATPYSYAVLVLVFASFATIAVVQIFLKSWVMGIVMSPIGIAFVLCIEYTRANLAHDSRIEAVIEAENILCNNIKDGVVAAVRNTLSVLPVGLRYEFSDFLDDVEQRNVHIRTALLELGNNLGSVSDDFIKKCISFELEEQEGVVRMFQDIVEINNIKLEMRTAMKRKFEGVVNAYIVGASMIMLFLIGVIALYPFVAKFYFTNVVGQLLIGLDFLILVAEFVYITYLRAQDL